MRRVLSFALILCMTLGLFNGLFFSVRVQAESPDTPHEMGWRYLYVATDGCDDNGDGSPQNPFASIRRAAQVVVPGTTVLVRGGIYYEHSIRPAVSGTPDGMIIFRPANPNDEVIIRHRHYFTGVSETDPEWASFLNRRGWTLEQTSHYDDLAREYAIAADRTQLTDVFDLSTRSYIKIEGFTFSDYRFARMTIDIGGDGNVVMNNRFMNLGTVHWGGEWHWWPTLKRGCVTLQIHGNYNVIRNNLFQNIYGEVISLGGNSNFNLITENTFVGIIGKNTSWTGSESSLIGGRFHGNWHNVVSFNYAGGSVNGGFIWLDICVNYMIVVRNTAYNVAYFIFNESGCERNWMFENIAFNRRLDADRRMPPNENLFTDFPAQQIAQAFMSSFWYVGASFDGRWINNVAYNVRHGLYIHISYRDEMRNNIVFADFYNQMSDARGIRLSEVALTGYRRHYDQDTRGGGPHILRNNIFYSAVTDRFIRYKDPLVSIPITVEELMLLEDAPDTLAVNPMFVNPQGGDFRLREGSPAIGTGDNGVDRGAFAIYPQFDVGRNEDLTLLADIHASFTEMITDVRAGDTINLELKLNQSATRKMRFEVVPVAGDARLDFDFYFPNGQTVTFNPGERRATVPITILTGNPGHEWDQLVAFLLQPVDGDTVLEEIGPRNAHMFRVRRQTRFSLSINHAPVSPIRPYTGRYYEEGDIVTVSVGTRPGFVFDYWQGGYHDIGVELADPRAETTTFVMPAGNVTLRPIWRPVANQVLPDSVTIDQDPLTLWVGETGLFTATVTPDNVTRAEISWGSSNPLVATVDNNGVVTAVSEGTALILARTLGGDLSGPTGYGRNRESIISVRVLAAEVEDEEQPEPTYINDDDPLINGDDPLPEESTTPPAPNDNDGISPVVIVVIIVVVLVVAAVVVVVIMKRKKK